MSKVFLLGANKQIDRGEQVVEVNQIIQMEGYSCDKYVVYEVSKNDWGITYKLINLRSKEFNTANIIRPLKEKFGIGFYYDSENPQFMDSFEVAILLQEAQQKKQAEDEETQQKRIRAEKIEEVGRVRLIRIFPEDAQAVIVARQMQDESDPYTDYHASLSRTAMPAPPPSAATRCWTPAAGAPSRPAPARTCATTGRWAGTLADSLLQIECIEWLG